jgi:NAD(P)-dependent dehydrogenase (short-subunit alcohol dehydrogenase family)
VLITGCSSGFGLESALAFARRDHTTYATMRDLAKADTLVDRAAAENLDIELLALDVDDATSVTSAIGVVQARHGAIDILVNNAGIDCFGSVETTDLERARAVMETNFWGPVRTIQAALPAMRAKGGAVIINVSSVSGSMPGTPYSSWYSASKHALNALSEALFIELDGIDVRVACVDPGFFKTEMVRNSRARGKALRSDPYEADQAWLVDFFEKSVEALGGDPVDVAEAIVRAADDPEAPVHNLVGQSASTLVDLARQAGSVEAWLPLAVSLVEARSPVPARGDEPIRLHHRSPDPTETAPPGPPMAVGLHWAVDRSDDHRVNHWFGARAGLVLTGRPTRRTR